jgi:hypothetical protein
MQWMILHDAANPSASICFFPAVPSGFCCRDETLLVFLAFLTVEAGTFPKLISSTMVVKPDRSFFPCYAKGGSLRMLSFYRVLLKWAGA